MTGAKSTVTLDGDWLLARIQQLEYILDEIRAKAADGAFAKPGAPEVDLRGITWKLKDSELAGPNDPWAWAFAYDQDGSVLPEASALLEAIKRDGKVLVGGYEISLGGRDKNLLNRKRVKK